MCEVNGLQDSECVDTEGVGSGRGTVLCDSPSCEGSAKTQSGLHREQRLRPSGWVVLCEIQPRIVAGLPVL